MEFEQGTSSPAANEAGETGSLQAEPALAEQPAEVSPGAADLNAPDLSAPAIQPTIEPAESTMGSAAASTASTTPLALSARLLLNRKAISQRALFISLACHAALLGIAWGVYHFIAAPRLAGVIGRAGGHISAPRPVVNDSLFDSTDDPSPIEPTDVTLPPRKAPQITLLQNQSVATIVDDRDPMPTPAFAPWDMAHPPGAANILLQPLSMPILPPGNSLPPQPILRIQTPASQPALGASQKSSAEAAPATQSERQNSAGSASGGAPNSAANGAANGSASAAPGAPAGSGESSHFTPPHPAGANSRRGGRAAHNGYDSRGLPIPDYPQEAIERGQQGVVILKVLIHTDGTPGDIAVINDAGYPILAKAAIAAVKEATFIPATSFGSPVEAPIELKFKFVLKD